MHRRFWALASPRPGNRLLVAMAATLAVLAFAPAAFADNITFAPAAPVVGEQVTFTDTAVSDCAKAYAWKIDGQPSTETSHQLTTTFSSAGSHTVVATVTTASGVSGCAGFVSHDSVTLTVNDALKGSISVSPDAPAPGQTATLAATQSGGSPGYTYAWDTDNDGNFDNGTTRQVTKTWSAKGTYTVRVRISDSAENQHVTIATKDVSVQQPAPPPPGSPPPPPPPPPPPCTKTVVAALAVFTTDGCFTQVASSPAAQWQTTDAIKLDGMPFPDYGQTFTITEPAAAGQPGHFTALNSAIKLGDFTAFSGDVDWTLPAGGKGDLKEVTDFPVLVGTKMFGLNVRGRIALDLGEDPDGTPYASLPMQIELPVGFNAGPDPSTGRVTGSAAIRVDQVGTGIHYEGLKLEAADVWLGKLKVDEACFSFIPAGAQSTAPCTSPTTIDQAAVGTAPKSDAPYLACGSDVNTNRWDGNAVVELPRGGARIAAFGGLADGNLSSLGAVADGLGRRVPLGGNVFLDKLGFGVCVTPAPLKLRGDVGVSIFPTTGDEAAAKIDGHVTYTDGTLVDPWTLEIGGTVDAFGTRVGNGSVTIHGWGGFDFGLQAGFDLYGVASVNGHIEGWVDPSQNTYNVSGGVRACVGGDSFCADGSGVVSNIGTAGCITVSTQGATDYGTLVVDLDTGAVHFATSSLSLTAGFGYRWGASWPDVFANTCDMGPYTQTRTFARAAAAGGRLGVKVAGGTAVESLNVRGTHGPPKIRLRGPGGTTITSPAQASSARSNGHWWLVESPKEGTTHVLLISPAAGRWTVAGVAGADSQPTAVETSKSQAPPALAAKVKGKRGRRLLRFAYAMAPGLKVRVVERAKGISRTLVRAAKGHPCARGPRTRKGTGQQVRCLDVRFQPAKGPGGVRKIEAVVTRGGIPVRDEVLTRFHVAKQGLPARPGPLRARRPKGLIQVAFPRVANASRYTVSAKLTDGRELSFDLGSSCRAVAIKGVPVDVGVTVRVAGVRYDLATGAGRSISLAAHAASAGPKGKKTPRRFWRSRKICS